jgi:hypothetical protein
MRAGMASMQAANAALQQQAASATVLQTGQPGSASILSIMDTGTLWGRVPVACMHHEFRRRPAIRARAGGLRSGQEPGWLVGAPVGWSVASGWLGSVGWSVALGWLGSPVGCAVGLPVPRPDPGAVTPSPVQ